MDNSKLQKGNELFSKRKTENRSFLVSGRVFSILSKNVFVNKFSFLEGSQVELIREKKKSCSVAVPWLRKYRGIAVDDYNYCRTNPLGLLAVDK